MWETWVQSLGRYDLLEKEMATHSSILAWKNPMDGGTWLGYSPWGRKESDMTERLHSLAHSDYQCPLFHSVHYFLPSVAQALYNKILRFHHIVLSPQHSSVQFSSVAQSCLTLCDPMNCSTTFL